MALADKVVANGNSVFEVDPAECDVALQLAHDALPAGGGVIECYGDSVWTFAAFLDVTKPNVTLRCNGTTMRPSPGITRAIQITAQGFRAERPRVLYSGATAASFAFFLFTESSAYQTNGGAILDGYFSLATTTDAQRVYAIQALGLAGLKCGRGLTIRGNFFEGQAGSTQQLVPWDGSNQPWGFIPIYCNNYEQVLIEGNVFTGECDAAESIPSGRFGAAAWLVDCRWSTFIGNTLAYMVTTTSTSGAQGAALIVNAVAGEGHHMAIVANVTENLAVDTVIRLLSLNHSLICANNIGRNGAGLDAGADTPRGALYAQGVGSLPIVGNNLHNTGGASPLILDGAKTIVIVGNDFSLLDPDVQIYEALNAAEVHMEPSTNPVAREL